MKPEGSITKPEPRLFALYGCPRGGPKKRSNGPKNSWNGSSSPPPPGGPNPGPDFTSWVVEMFTTEGATCSARPEKSGSITAGAGGGAGDVACFSEPPPNRFSASLCGN